jgi:hypothetical protein
MYPFWRVPTLCVPKLNNSLAKEPISTQDANKRATWTLDAKDKQTDLQSIVRDNCKHLSANYQQKLLKLLIYYELLFDGTLGNWKTKPVSFQVKEENNIPWPSCPSAKNTQDIPSSKLRGCVNWGN